LHARRPINSEERSGVAAGRGASGGPPQATAYKGQQVIVNILNEKSGLSTFNKFYNNVLYSRVDCFIIILFNFQTK
jgi:hypothetical protein